MNPQALKVLAVHGIGDHRTSLDWQHQWNKAAQRGMASTKMKLANDTMTFITYNEKFDEYTLGVSNTSSAAYRAVSSCLTGFLRQQASRMFWRQTSNARFIGSGFSYINNLRKRIMGKMNMIVNWVDNESLRQELRDNVMDSIRDHKPDIICGHSLGSLICYDALTSERGKSLLKKRVFVSMGSQIGSCAVADVFAGRIYEPECGHWYNLHNKDDWVLTPSINVVSAGRNSYMEIPTNFEEGILNHSAEGYLSDYQFWSIIKEYTEIPSGESARSIPRQMMSLPTVNFTHPVVDSEGQVPPKRRALLVGINEYPEPGMRLDGCVNDVFTISSVLQECGFAPEEIRVVFDDRATKAGLVERLHWLLDDARPGDQLVFSFCGHGAQVPTYGPVGPVDHVTECLVPYDFDWSLESAVSDMDLQDMYSQLPYETSFLMLLDCCHSGGLARDGGRVIRGLNPPDDIRHRILRWDVERQMWVRREFAPLHAEFAAMEHGDEYVGATGDVLRIGSAMCLRGLSNEEFDRVTKERGHLGPYMPLIVHACQEDEFAYEYQHGVISHGAFTFVLSKLLREYNRERGFTVSFEELVQDAAEELADLGYEQNPDLIGPDKVREADIPWGTTLERKKQRRKSKPKRS
jgi:metacaspase-1